jgi:hypothetical protein
MFLPENFPRVRSQRQQSGTLLLFTWAFYLLFSAVGLSGQSPLTPPANSLSAQRIERLGKLTHSLYEKYELNISREKALDRVLRQFALSDSCPLVPQINLLTESECKKTAKEKNDRLTNEKYPPQNQVQLDADAAEKFPYYEIGEKVTITYMVSPVRKSTITGIYQGKKVNVLLFDNRRIIQWKDFIILPENKTEIPKYFPEESQKLRKDYLEKIKQSYNQERTAFQQKSHAELLAREYSQAIVQNEQAGYIYHQGQWQDLKTIATILVDQEHKRLEGEAEKARQKAAAELAEAEKRRATELAEAEKKRQAEAKQAAELAEAKRLQAAAEAAKAAAAEAERQKAAELAEAERVKAEALQRQQAQAQKTAAQKTAKPPSKKQSNLLLLLGGLVGLIILGGGAAVAILLLKNRTPGKFYDGTEKPGKGFWPIPDKDKASTPHISVKFPTQQEAFTALSQLSFLEFVPGKLKLRSKHPIHFGLVCIPPEAPPPKPEEPNVETDGESSTEIVPETTSGSVLAFIAGKDFSYAMRREAQTILPDMPGASDCLLGKSPRFNITLPQTDPEDDKLKLVEDVDGTPPDYGHYWVYEGADMGTALLALKACEVGEDGLKITIKTPDGDCTKTIKGLGGAALEATKKKKPGKKPKKKKKGDESEQLPEDESGIPAPEGEALPEDTEK